MKYKGKLKIEATIEFETNNIADFQKSVEEYKRSISLSGEIGENSVTTISDITLLQKGIVCGKDFGKIGKFHLKKFVSKSEYKPRQGGIHYSNGFAMATDGHKLAAIKTEYDPGLEGKILNKEGYFIDGDIIDWQSVVPPAKDILEEITLNTTETQGLVREKMKEAKKEIKLLWVQVKTKKQCIYFQPDNFLLFLYFLKHFPDCKITTYGDYKPIKACNEKGDTCLLVPVGRKVNDEFNTILEI